MSALRPGLGLKEMEALSSTIRTTVINVGFFAALLLLVPAVAAQFSRAAVVIDPIAVPRALAEQGLTADVMANRLWDGLQGFATSASDARATFTAIPDNQLVEFSLPDTGISLDSIFAQARQFFRIPETRIAGEVTCATPDCAASGLQLRLRVVRANADIVDLPPMGARSEADYFREAAAGVFTVLDPFVAIAAQAETNPDRAAVLARQLIASGHADAKWAHNLLGDIARKAGAPAEAAEAYRAALGIDADFTAARIGLGLALTALGDYEEARADLATARAREPKSLRAAEALAALDIAIGDRPAAIAELLTAADLAPHPADYLAQAGELSLALGEAATGRQQLEDALLLDPGNVRALRALGTLLNRDGNLAAAEMLYRNWADYLPESPEARLQLGDVLSLRGKPAEAIEPYQQAVRLAPGEIRPRLRLIEMLIEANKLARARDTLTQLQADFPGDPTSLFLDAEILRARKDPGAADAYRRYLFLHPSGAYAGQARAALEERD